MPIDNIDQDSLVAGFLPKVFFTRITLESSAKNKKPAPGENPHIDFENENKYAGMATDQLVKQTSGKKLITSLDLSIKEMIDPDTLTGYWFDNEDFYKYIIITVLRSNTAEVTNALATGKLKAGAGNYTNPWYEEDFSKLLDANLITHVSTLGLNNFLDWEKAFNYSGYKTFQHLKALHKTQTPDGVTVYSFNKTLNDYKFSNKAKDNPNHIAYVAFAHLDIDAIENDFDVDMANPNPIDLQNGFNLPNGSRVYNNSMGPLSFEVVVDKYKLNNHSNVFLDAKGKIWTGAVHAMTSNGQIATDISTFGVEDPRDMLDQEKIAWMAGSYHGEIQPEKYLTKRSIMTNKVQDFRILDELEKLEIDMSKLRNFFIDGGARKQHSSHGFGEPTTGKLTDMTRYFSQMWLSKDHLARPRFAFGFNKRNFVIDNSQFSGLFNGDNSGVLYSFLKHSYIRSIRLFRRRVNESSATQTRKISSVAGPIEDINNSVYKHGYERFDKERGSADILIAESIMNPSIGTNIIPQGVSNNGGISEFNFGTNNIQAVKHITGLDMSLTSVTEGEYQYYVDIEVVDGTRKFLENTANDFAKTIKMFKSEYFNLAEQYILKNTKRQTEFGVLSYLRKTNRLPIEFIDEIRSKYPKAGQNPWISLVDGIYKVLKLISPTVKVKNVESLTQLKMWLNSFVCPETSNLETINSILTFSDNILFKIRDLLNTSSPSVKTRGDISHEGYPTGGPTVPERSMKIRHYFEETCSITDASIGGYDFLQLHTDAQSGISQSEELQSIQQLAYTKYSLSRYPLEMYVKRVDQEVLKHFVEGSSTWDWKSQNNILFAGDNTEITKMTYLTPQMLFVTRGNDGGGSVSSHKIVAPLLLGTPGYSHLVNAALDTLSFNIGRQGSFSAASHGEVTGVSKLGGKWKANRSRPAKTKLINILADSNVSVRQLQNFGKDFLLLPAPIPVEGEKQEAMEFQFGAAKANPNGFLDNIDNDEEKKAKNEMPPKFHTYNADGIASTSLMMLVMGMKYFNSLNKDLHRYNLEYNGPLQEFKQYWTAKGAAANTDFLNPTQMPNQIKALYVTNMKNVPVVTRSEFFETDPALEPAYYPPYYFSSQKIVEVQALVGYQNDAEGSPMLNAPIWTPLTQAVLSLKALTKNILCRMKPWVDPQYNDNVIEELELPTLNEYFILENTVLENPAIGNVAINLKPPVEADNQTAAQQTLDQDLINLDKQIISFSPEFTASGIGIGTPPTALEQELLGGQGKMQSLPGDKPKKENNWEIPTADPKNPPGNGKTKKKKKQGPVGNMNGAGDAAQKKKTIGSGVAGKKKKSIY